MMEGTTIVASVVEGLAFLLPLEPGEEGPAASWTRRVMVPWHGPDGSAGSVWVTFDEGAALAVTANLLTGAASPEDIDPSLCEVANVIAGNLLPGLYGADHEYHLGQPRSVDAVDADARLVADSAFLEGRIAVSLVSDAQNTRILRRQ